jgi:hypothetical protein
MTRNLLKGLSRRAAFSALLALILALCVGPVLAANAGSVAGDWEGKLEDGGQTLRIVVHISQDKDGKLSATLDSPDQDAKGIAVSSITYKDPDLHFEIEQIGGSFDGKSNKDLSEISGQWKQGGGSTALSLKRTSK